MLSEKGQPCKRLQVRNCKLEWPVQVAQLETLKMPFLEKLPKKLKAKQREEAVKFPHEQKKVQAVAEKSLLARLLL